MTAISLHQRHPTLSLAAATSVRTAIQTATSKATKAPLLAAVLLASNIILPPFAPLASAASFDCAKGTTHIEHMICANPQLSAMDEQLMRTYQEALRRTNDATAVRQQQRAWLKTTRERCQDDLCLITVYQEQILTLKAHMTALPPLANTPDIASDNSNPSRLTLPRSDVH